jgi:hypothetical protein
MLYNALFVTTLSVLLVSPREFESSYAIDECHCLHLIRPASHSPQEQVSVVTQHLCVAFLSLPGLVSAATSLLLPGLVSAATFLLLPGLVSAATQYFQFSMVSCN